MAGAPHASWYYALTTPDGAPLAVGLIRRRPTTEVAANPTLGAGRVEVWLQLTPEELQRLVHAPPPGWETIITDLAGRQPAGAPNGDPRRRIPGEMLRRWINIRDRYCSFPGCRIAAHRTQVDHTHDYALGGQTVDRNLGSACGADHPLKDKGWHLRQSRPGVFVWTSPLGHQYTRTLPPGPEHAFAPMPDPTRPDEDDFLIYTSDTWDGPDSCRTICDPPLLPTPPRAAPKPAPHPPQEGDEIPF